MKLLIDNPLSPLVAQALVSAGFDAVHVRDIGLAEATDQAILERAESDGRIIISADTDFGTILALRSSAQPSFVLLRGDIERSPRTQIELLTAHLPLLAEELETGSVVVITRDRLRVRALPIIPEE